MKSEYKYNDDEEETEKSEMETLQDLKRATEQAIRELQIEAAKADKRKGKNIYYINFSAPSLNYKDFYQCENISSHGKINTISSHVEISMTSYVLPRLAL